MVDLLKCLLPSVGTLVVIIILVLLIPEKLEKWWSIILRMFVFINRKWHRRLVTHDLQGRVNGFVRRLSSTVPTLASERIKVQWVDESDGRKALLDKGDVVLRLRRDDPEDHNFIHGSYLFVSASLLEKPKRYMSPSQRDALDLYVCSCLLESEKSHLIGIFVDKYLHPKTADPQSKVASYVDDFAAIDHGGFFFPVLLQELDFLGNRIFGRRNDQTVVAEVDGLVNFLKPIANRKVGEENELNYAGGYCRFGIVLVGKPIKLMLSIDPYVEYIRSTLIRNNAETIYLVGRSENQDKLKEICTRFSPTYGCERPIKFKRNLRYENGSVKQAQQVLVILRKTGVPIVRHSAT